MLTEGRLINNSFELRQFFWLVTTAKQSSSCCCCDFCLLCTGCGFGLVYLPSIVVASHWFQAKRGTAMGFIVSGSGVGASVMSKVVVFLFSRYDWRGVVWIIVGLILNMVAMGTLFRPIRSADFRVMKKDEDDDSIHVDHTPTVRTTHIGNRGWLYLSSFSVLFLE